VESRAIPPAADEDNEGHAGGIARGSTDAWYEAFGVKEGDKLSVSRRMRLRIW
jgi:hypothetical protein